MKRLFKFKYPKITLLILFTALSHILFSQEGIRNTLSNIEYFGYLGVFIAGLLFSFGFTSPFAVGLLITLKPSNLLLASIIGGLGALIADLLIFNIIRFSFIDEFNSLKKERTFVKLTTGIDKNIPKQIKNYLLYLFVGFVIASPLPDEMGVTMLTGLTHIKQKVLAVISFILNTLGILIILILFANQ